MKSRAEIMKILLGAIVVSSATQPVAAFKLPMQVTPAVRVFSEADVRRLCVDRGSTMSMVKVYACRKLMRLNFNRRMRILQAGLR